MSFFPPTHNLTEAEKLCQQVGVIRQGKLIASGSPDELRRTSGKPQLEISGSGFSEQVLAAIQSLPSVSAIHNDAGQIVIEFHQSASSAPILNLLVQAGAQIEEVRKGKVDLEQAFLSLLEQE